MFSLLRKKKNSETTDEVKEISDDDKELLINKKPTIWDVIAPEGIGISKRSDDYGIIKQSLGTRTYFRPFYITRDGYPRKLETNWLNSMLSMGEIDVMIDYQKKEKPKAMKLLQKQTTILKATRRFQSKKGNDDAVKDTDTKIADNDLLMDEIQFSENDLYDVSITGIMYAESERYLDRLSESLEDEMASMFFKVASTWGRVKKGFRTNTPLSLNEIPDSYRNLDRRSLVTFAPFISGSGKFNGGIPIGINKITGQKEFYNAFGTPDDRPTNYNMAIFGTSGSGKTTLVELLLGRETTGMGVYTRLIDVEGEYTRVVKKLGGINITLSEESKIRLNPLSINVTTIPFDPDDEELEELENSDERVIIERDGEKFIQFVPIREKINESIEFFDIICRGKNQEEDGANVFERNYLEEALKYLYMEDERFQFSTHPSSLYEEKPKVVNNIIEQIKVKKDEPTLTDVFDYLTEHYSTEPKAQRLLASIRPFLRDGSKPIFDGQNYFGKKVNVDLHTTRLVNFNISQMEEGFLKPVAYHVILNYIWEYFVKNIENANKRKIVVCDEFWTLVDNPQTVAFSEKMARRSRKRHAGFRIASQDFVRILESEKARAVLQNTESFVFLKQKPLDLTYIVDNFDLTRGERAILFSNPDEGEGILRIGKSSLHFQTDPSKEELEFMESNRAVLKERKKYQRLRS